MTKVSVLVLNGVVVGVFDNFETAKTHAIKEWATDTSDKKWKMEEADDGYDTLMFVSSNGDVLDLEEWEVTT